jgi:hypothetical protein
VFKPNDFVEGNPGMERMGVRGLGVLLYDTRRGVFGQEVHGGGIFASLNGGALGRGLTAEEQARVSGGTTTTSGESGPSQSYTPTFDPTLTTTTTAPSSTTAVPGLKSPDARVSTLQQYMNRVLEANGYRKIDVDGKLGKGTCGAIAWYKKTGRALATGTTRDRIEENLAYVGALYDAACAAKTPWSMPSKTGTTSSSTYTPSASKTPAATEPYAYKAPGMSDKTKAAVAIGVGAVLAVGVAYVGKKKGWF